MTVCIQHSEHTHLHAQKTGQPQKITFETCKLSTELHIQWDDSDITPSSWHHCQSTAKDHPSHATQLLYTCIAVVVRFTSDSIITALISMCKWKWASK